MTDELDQAAIGEPEVGQDVGDVSDGMVSADASMAAGFTITVDDGVDAAKWVWRHTLGEKREKAPEPGGISIDLPTEEETTIRSSSVAHEDPPPPPREPEFHEPEHASQDPHKAEGGQ